MAVLTARVLRGAAAAWVLAAAFGTPLDAQLTQDQALRLAFGSADVERRTAFLDEGQLDAARELAGPRSEIERGVVSYYVASDAGRPVGVAYFDAHRVRTLQEVLMIVVDPRGRVVRVETVSFREPPEYEAPEGWLAQFRERPLDEALSLRGEIAPMTGATLTANAVTQAVRRTLALHQVIDPVGARQEPSNR
ncbi:MAG: FMN-binding protein [Gemmatimonadetes bacterium]|nr:FMN-binding protein [Gemmatimonadota bacterium]